MAVLAGLLALAAGILWVLQGTLPRPAGYSLFDFLRGKAPPSFSPEQYTLPEHSPLAGEDVPILDRLNAEYAKLAAAVVPSVVSIDTRETVAVQSPFPGFYRQMQRPGLGSGVIVTPEGHVLTNQHVVSNKDSIRITCTAPDGGRESFAAEMIGSLSRYDLAVLKIRSNRTDFPALKFGDSGQVHPGQLVFAIGSPYGLSESVTQGIISGIERRLRDSGPSYYLQTDTPINPGNSGGPLVNHLGEVIGINTAIYRGSQYDVSAQNIGFAIPSNQAMEAFQIITGRGRPVSGYVGLEVADMTLRAAAFLGMDEVRGVLVKELDPQGPAARSGLRPMDVILGMDGRPVVSQESFLSEIKSTPPGTLLKLSVWRDRAMAQVQVTVEEERETNADSASEAGADNPPVLSRQEAVEWLRRIGLSLGSYGAGEDTIRVEAVAADSLAAGKVQVGDIVRAVNGKEVNSPARYNQAVLAGRTAAELRLTIERQGRRSDVVIPLR